MEQQDFQTEPLSAQQIRRYLAECPFTVQVYPKVTSTNQLLHEQAQCGAAEGLVLLAEEQTAGRGRFARHFYSPAGTGLYMSLLLRPRCSPSELSRLTVAAAVAVAESVETVAGCVAQIKWVNDVFVHGKKVCGILTESVLSSSAEQADYVVIGWGINVTPPAQGFAPAIREIAGAVWEPGAMPPDGRHRLAAAVLERFWQYYQSRDCSRVMTEYQRRSCVIGREIMVRAGDSGGVPAQALAIDEDGRLLVRYRDGREQWLISGEVSIGLSR